MRAGDSVADLSGLRLISNIGLAPRLRSNASPSSESELLTSIACAAMSRAATSPPSLPYSETVWLLL
eukprot:2284417-Prymnesium_polylepis.1